MTFDTIEKIAVGGASALMLSIWANIMQARERGKLLDQLLTALRDQNDGMLKINERMLAALHHVATASEKVASSQERVADSQQAVTTAVHELSMMLKHGRDRS